MDRYSREKRSEIMRLVRSAGTKPERMLGMALEHAGLVYLPQQRVEGVRVDFLLPDYRIALFVDGCFWHGCTAHRPVPKSNRDFWYAKVRGNRARDRRNSQALRRADWTVVRVWEHTVIRNPRRAVGAVKRAIRRSTSEHPAASVPHE